MVGETVSRSTSRQFLRRATVFASILALMLPGGPSAASTTDLQLAAIARDSRTRELLYVESHYIQNVGRVGEQRVVLYRCSLGGPAFARKELTYGTTRAVPEFTLFDARSGYQEGLRRTASGIKVFQRADARAPQREASVPQDAALVVDAGFDEFVRSQWTELEAGNTVKFSFLVPSRLEALTFKIRKHHDSTFEGVPVSVIRLALSGVIGWVLPHIDVSYRKSDRALLRYEGLTNMRDEKGDNHVAVIEFPNAARREVPVDLGAVRNEPLIARCPAPRAS